MGKVTVRNIAAARQQPLCDGIAQQGISSNHFVTNFPAEAPSSRLIEFSPCLSITLARFHPKSFRGGDPLSPSP